MKGAFGFIVLIAMIVVGGVFAYNKYSAKALEADQTEDFARIQREYLERVGWIRDNPDEKAYKDEVGTFFRWYFKEVNEHQNHFGGNKKFDDYLTELEGRSERLSDNQLKEHQRVYEYVKSDFDLMKNGQYSPVYTATSQGMRFDILSTDVKMVGGQRKIELPIVLWGAQREMREDGKVKRMMTSASFNITWRLFDEKGKLYGEMSASGDPADKVDFPERFIKEFPAQMVIGHYDMDLLPAKVARIEMEFAITSRAPSGGEAHATYTWKLDTPAEWKLGEGEAWSGAQEDVRPMEEIDPAAAHR